MRDYDRASPLIFIHIPKAAGLSCQKVFKSWFGDNLHRHYAREADGEIPKPVDIFGLHSEAHPLCVFGHFNRNRKRGLETCYPDAPQFMTILRDPFQRLVSQYFFMRKNAAKWKRTVTPTVDLLTYIDQNQTSFLDHFPKPVTADNYKDICEEYFIEIGIAEKLDESLSRIAGKLGFTYENNVPFMNRTARPLELPEGAEERFRDKRWLEYEVYDYALQKY